MGIPQNKKVLCGGEKEREMDSKPRLATRLNGISLIWAIDSRVALSSSSQPFSVVNCTRNVWKCEFEPGTK